jgi:YVTN family beta-propeller protein
VAEIAVGQGPRAMAVNETNGRLYVANYDVGTYSVVDVASSSVLATVPSGGYYSDGIGVNPATGLVYVANNFIGGMTIFAEATNGLVGHVFPLPPLCVPTGIGVDAPRSRVYVVGAHCNALVIVDAATNAVTGSVPVPTDPTAIAVDDSTGLVYVLSSFSGIVSVVDPVAQAVVDQAPVTAPGPWAPPGLGGRGIAVSSATGRVFVTDSSTDSVHVLTRELDTVGSIGVGGRPWGVAVNPATDRAYVANEFGGSVSVLDGGTLSLVATVPVAQCPHGVTVHVPSDQVYVSHGVCTGFNFVSVIADPRPLYDWEGFLATFRNPPVLNDTSSKTVQTFWFRLGGDRGLDVLDGIPASRRIDCSTKAPLGDLSPAEPPAWSGLAYHASTQRYSYPWKPPKGNAYAGTCRELVLTLADGSSHSAWLRFVK